ncbi:sigma-54 dependent transcriptional regulator [Cocleimonas sp. KMM 6892]|uniref:sigma-54-dependent transcriptional regulator n=1 Tax=unclassified Cocleimonas TaxID=2639732 RepID=UPI002DBA4174|nr:MULTISPECIES: sigma-54 dependent transcriptional regulator [unclassified Cocleimonas]MEB8433709.1 sigma-54 dependent transcriptional regulator [Cocleimonas sp. KMM 6892]MEC4716520.1 sigma-54 dependent transcriptional regulator [Cocleimonas sp. KMM 6895]MEC4746325.1 sigma-54 dependent transcriptional regulator [Cocleimonas sp. KMM 6896]
MNKDISIMMVDDDEKTLLGLSIILKTKGYTKQQILTDAEKVIPEIITNKPDIILLDLHMPNVCGLDLLSKIKKDFPEKIVIMITGDDTVDVAIKCTRLGASDYFVKPIDHERLFHVIENSIEEKNHKQELLEIQQHLLDNTVTQSAHFSNILTENTGMKKLFKYIEAIAQSNRPVLILGETGTGKELFAHAVHNVSNSTGNIVTVNAAGLDDTAFSDSLFGHKKGAFTGALQNREGLIKKAKNGSIFLDEIGDLKPQSQIKLLRLIQENTYYPLGSDISETNTARIITATHQNLEALISEGSFRNDLYFRLQIHTIKIPPLRERRDDIPVLTKFFLKRACEELGKESPEIPNELYDLFNNHLFLGNVRELEMLLYDAAIHTTGDTLSLDHIKKHLALTSSGDSAKAKEVWGDFVSMYELPTIKNSTNNLIDEALKRCDNNQKKASSILGITRQALNKRLSRRDEPSTS